MPNLNILLNAIMTTTDQTLSSLPTIITRNFNNPTLGATVDLYIPFAQVVNPTTLTITLPNPTVWIVYVKHIGNSGNLTVNFTPAGGATQNVLLVPGGVFLYFQPSEGAGGITALSLASSAGTIPADVYAAA